MPEDQSGSTAKLSLAQRLGAWIARSVPAGIVLIGLVILGVGVVRATSGSAGTLVIVGAGLILAPFILRDGGEIAYGPFRMTWKRAARIPEAISEAKETLHEIRDSTTEAAVQQKVSELDAEMDAIRRAAFEVLASPASQVPPMRRRRRRGSPPPGSQRDPLSTTVNRL